MKPSLITVWLTLLLFGGLSAVQAHKGDRQYPFFELTDEDLATIDLHDGVVTDWEAVAGEATVTTQDFEADRSFDLYDPDDMDFRIWLAWHDATNRIYVAMERVDDVYINDYVRVPVSSSRNNTYMRWNDSAISFGVDGDHSGGQAGWDSYPSSPDDVEPFLQISHRQVQLYSAIAETFDDGAQVLLYHFNNMYTRAPLPNWWSRSFWFLTPPYGDGGGTRLGTQPINTVTEFYVTPFDLFVWDHPEETRISELEQGKVIGFGISIVDRDEPSLFTSSGSALHRLPPGGRVFERPEVYGDGVLLGPAGGLETTVESTTWGRIKATFE